MNPGQAARDSENIYQLLARCGIGLPMDIQNNLMRGHIRLNNKIAGADDHARHGDQLEIGSFNYQVERSRNSGHLRVLPTEQDNSLIPGKRMVQCGYHKCLTMYFRKVFSRTLRTPFVNIGNFTHFFHRLDEFYRHCGNYSISSISGHAIDLDRFEAVLVTRFIRDPRDLLVSGYFYHKRAAETWCDLIDPEDSDWEVVNGKVPEQIPNGLSFSQYLNQANQEQGLIAELSFRERHYDSMLQWQDDPRVRLFRYEDMIGNEISTYDQMFEFYGFPGFARLVGRYYAGRYRAAKKQAKAGHVRNASAGQWRNYFTPELTRRFNQRYETLIEKLGYPLD